MRIKALPDSRKWSIGAVISHHKTLRSYTLCRPATVHTDATAGSCNSQLEPPTQKPEYHCPDPTSEDYAAQPSLLTQAATADCAWGDSQINMTGIIVEIDEKHP